MSLSSFKKRLPKGGLPYKGGGESLNDGYNTRMIGTERAEEVVVPGPLEERSLEDEIFEALIGIVNELKDRCYELTDEVGANQDMVTFLRQTLIKANHQVEI
uniref:Uncharacterized protein n=1 Tax=Parascaris equorum TaxID=6256 RepID=A0A914RRT2_PAREQ